MRSLSWWVSGASLRSSPSPAGEGDAPVSALEVTGDVRGAPFAQDALEWERLERGVDDEDLAVGDPPRRLQDLVDRFATGRQRRVGVDDPGTTGDVDRPLVGTLIDVPRELSGPGSRRAGSATAPGRGR